MAGRVLLADDSPHAQRMGERILREEGYEVVTVTDGETALLRLEDVDPDVILVDVFLPLKSGYEICRKVKADPRHQHAGVVLIAGLLEPVDEEEAQKAGSDAVLKKPFEASIVLGTIRPLMEQSRSARGLPAEPAESPYDADSEFYSLEDEELPPLDVDAAPPASAPAPPEADLPPAAGMPTETLPSAETAPHVPQPWSAAAKAAVAAATQSGLNAALAAHATVEENHSVETQTPTSVSAEALPVAEFAPLAPVGSAGRSAEALQIDEERVRAAVTLAMDRALPALVDEITEKVLIALGH